jgi:hypothetical protein
MLRFRSCVLAGMSQETWDVPFAGEVDFVCLVKVVSGRVSTESYCFFFLFVINSVISYKYPSSNLASFDVSCLIPLLL